MIIFTFCLFVWLPNFPSSLGIRWLIISQLDPATASSLATFCDQLRGSFTARQIRFCKKHPGYMDSLVSGAMSAIRECQHQFLARRWNCSSVPRPLRKVTVSLEKVRSTRSSSHPEKRNARIVTIELDRYPFAPPGTRESAFLHAVSASGVAYAVTRSCSSGLIADCGCDRTARPAGHDFYWSGCSDNVEFGATFSRTFVDAQEHHIRRKMLRKSAKKAAKNVDADVFTRTLIDLHNNEVGRKVIEKNMKMECKCHGISGSCQLKTCWRAMPSFRELGHRLKQKFDGATEVRPQTTESRRVLVPRNANYKPYTDSDLIYVAKSPNFCEANFKLGSSGTRGRQCNKTSRGIDGCDLLCCNRGYETKFYEVTERCQCKFQWCCQVHCNMCTKRIDLHKCL